LGTIAIGRSTGVNDDVSHDQRSFYGDTRVSPGVVHRAGFAKFMLVRAMFGLIVIVLIVYLIAMRPFRSAIASCVQKASHFFGRKS
jgi:hypothetical protein